MKTLIKSKESKKVLYGLQKSIDFNNSRILNPVLKSRTIVSENGQLSIQQTKVNELTLDSNILTNDGWKSIQKVEIGENIASIDGSPNTLIGIGSSGVQEIFRVKFSDGREINVSANHQWFVNNRKWKSPKLLSVLELIEYLTKPSYQNRIWIELFSGIQDLSTHLSIDPWILGYLLGNGSMCNSIRFTTNDAFCIFKLRSRLSDKYKITYAGDYSYRIVNVIASRTNDLLQELRNMGLGTVNSYSKFIPVNYFNSSKDNRILLLQGLMDSDGWCEKSGSLRYSSSSPQLAIDVMKLVWSLGGIGSIKKKDSPKFTYKGESKIGAPSYTCKIRFSDPENYVTTYKKKKRARNSSTPRLNISSVSYLGREEVHHLEVSHPTNSYVTNDYLIT